ncbi:hypothetical protein D3C85_1302860 [compost metagenome]
MLKLADLQTAKGLVVTIAAPIQQGVGESQGIPLLLPAAAGAEEVIQLTVVGRWLADKAQRHLDRGFIDAQDPVEDDKVGDGLARPQDGRPLIDILILSVERARLYPEIVAVADDGAIGQQGLDGRPGGWPVQAETDERRVVPIELVDVIGEDLLVKPAQIALHQAQCAVMALGQDPALRPVDIECGQTGRHQYGLRVSPLLLAGRQHSPDHLI